MHRSEILDELVPHVSTIQLQDSLQHLASLSEEERMAVVERIIAEVKAREEAERQAAEDAELEEQKMQVAQLQGAMRRQPGGSHAGSFHGGQFQPGVVLLQPAGGGEGPDRVLAHLGQA